jgi:hypothetical protein
LEFTTTLQSRLGSVMDTFENHIKDQRQHHASKALQRTIPVHQLNLTNTQITETWESAKEVTHDLKSLLGQLEGIVDALRSPTPPMSYSPPPHCDFLEPPAYKRLCSRTNPKDVPTALTDLKNLTRENVQANALLLEAQRTSTRIKKAILDAKLT